MVKKTFALNLGHFYKYKCFTSKKILSKNTIKIQGFKPCRFNLTDKVDMILKTVIFY